MQPQVVQGEVPTYEDKDKFNQQFEDSRKHFLGPNSHAQLFQAFDKFARFIPEKGRRELWPESVARVISFFRKHAESNGFPIPEKTWEQLAVGLLDLKASPAMRCVQMAGPALERCHVGVYNCAFQFLKCPKDMAEELYVLMQGTGVGFSVEYEESVKFWPAVSPRDVDYPTAKHVVEDNTEAWCTAYRLGLETWLAGRDVEFDLSRIRPEGTPLKTKGGRASGPGPLRDLLTFTRNRILSRQGERLTSLDLHDINCYAHRIVQMGGVRRASGISLSDLDDVEMQNAKVGQFWDDNPQRNQANNSTVYREKPPEELWQAEWEGIRASGTGERGIFNRGSLKNQFPERRTTDGYVFGTNPCGEIVLRHKQFCNLSIAVIRPDDTLEDIVNKVRLATIWGTLQSTMTNFNYLGPDWKKNSEEERLLGVDLLGFLDHPVLTDPSKDSEVALSYLKEIVRDTNVYWSELLGINHSAALTCIKPSGDSSIFFDTAAGFKGHHGKHYIRRFRANATNPVACMLRDAGVPCYPDYDNSELLVLEFPMRSPDNGTTLESQTALGQLELWLRFKRSWTEHNPSVTIYIRDEEWGEVGSWVYRHWDDVGGLSFMPYDGGIYPLAPYEAITADEYASRSKEFPAIDWSQLMVYEKEDMTEITHQYACTGDKCSI